MYVQHLQLGATVNPIRAQDIYGGWTYCIMKLLFENLVGSADFKYLSYDIINSSFIIIVNPTPHPIKEDKTHQIQIFEDP